MSSRLTIMLVLLVVVTHHSRAAERALSSSDLAKIKRVCRSVIGYPVAKEDDLWSPLKPFLRANADLKKFPVICSSQHCEGRIRLRDGCDVWYTYFHAPPERSKVGPSDLTPDIEYKGNNRFVGVALVRHGKVVFSQGDAPSKSLIENADEMGDI